MKRAGEREREAGSRVGATGEGSRGDKDPCQKESDDEAARTRTTGRGMGIGIKGEALSLVLPAAAAAAAEAAGARDDHELMLMRRQMRR